MRMLAILHGGSAGVPSSDAMVLDGVIDCLEGDGWSVELAPTFLSVLPGDARREWLLEHALEFDAWMCTPQCREVFDCDPRPSVYFTTLGELPRGAVVSMASRRLHRDGDVWCITADRDRDVLAALFDDFIPDVRMVQPRVRQPLPAVDSEVVALREFMAKQIDCSASELKLFVYCGRVMPEKNVHVLVECIKRARKSDPSIALLVAGPIIPQAPWDILTDADGVEFALYMAECFRKESAVLHLGTASARVVDVALAAADGFVTLSTNRDENFGLALREAESVKVPVVATAWGGHLNADGGTPSRELIPVFLSGWGTHVDEVACVRSLLRVNEDRSSRSRSPGGERRTRPEPKRFAQDGSRLSEVGSVIEARGVAGLAEVAAGQGRRIVPGKASRAWGEVWKAYGAVDVMSNTGVDCVQLRLSHGVKRSCGSRDRHLWRRDDFAWASAIEVEPELSKLLEVLTLRPVSVSRAEGDLWTSTARLVNTGLAYAAPEEASM